VPITVGGGGIPVVEHDGALRGVEAVIDKDLASSLLAVELKAELFVILTQVDKVYINYKSDHQQPLERAKLDYLKELYDRGTSLLGLWVPRFWLPSSTWKTLMARLQLGLWKKRRQ